MPSAQVTGRARPGRTPATYSNTWQNACLTYSDSIGSLRDRYNRVAPHFKDPEIESALRAVETARPAFQHFIEYMIVQDKCGFIGTAIYQDQCAATVRRISAPRFAPRTLRDAAVWAERAGFIRRSYVPNGARVETAQGWRTKRTVRYIVRARLRLLTSILSIKPALNGAQAFNRRGEGIGQGAPVGDVAHFPTLANLASNPSGKQETGGHTDDPPVSMLACPKRRFEKAAGDNVECAASAHGSTCPPAKRDASRPTREHQTPNNRATREGRNKSAPLLAPPRSLSRTWHSARNRFLSCLFAYLKPGSPNAPPNADRMYAAAALQTAAQYPPNLPAAVDWNDRLLFAADLHWRDLRRLIQKEIAPALAVFIEDWTPPPSTEIPAPNLASSRSSGRAFEAWEMSLIPPPGISVRVSNVPAYYAAWPFVRAWISAALHGARFEGVPGYVRDFCALREV